MIFAVIYLLFAALFGLIGSSMASSRNRSSGLWFLVCALFGIFGIILLAVLGNNTEAGASVGQTAIGRDTYDRAKWQVLSEVDADIKGAIEKVSPLGDQWVKVLAQKYLAVGDKQYLDSIVENVIQSAESGGGEPETGRAGNSTFKRRQDGSYVIVGGAFVGTTFRNFDDMAERFKRDGHIITD